MSPPRKPQARLRYSKLGKLRFTSHRDMARIWERAVRRAQLPIAYSEGFSPRAKLSFGLALPTVFESRAEFVDLTLDEQVEIDDALRESRRAMSQVRRLAPRALLLFTPPLSSYLAHLHLVVRFGATRRVYGGASERSA